MDPFLIIFFFIFPVLSTTTKKIKNQKTTVGLDLQRLDVQLVQPGFVSGPTRTHGPHAPELGHVRSHFGIVLRSVSLVRWDVRLDSARSFFTRSLGLAWTQVANELYPNLGLVSRHWNPLDGRRCNWRDYSECTLDRRDRARVYLSCSRVLCPLDGSINHD